MTQTDIDTIKHTILNLQRLVDEEQVKLNQAPVEEKDGGYLSTTQEPGEAPKCQIHFYKEAPITMLRREAKDGHIYYDHRTQIEGVWKRCKGQGYF